MHLLHWFKPVVIVVAFWFWLRILLVIVRTLHAVEFNALSYMCRHVSFDCVQPRFVRVQPQPYCDAHQIALTDCVAVQVLPQLVSTHLSPGYTDT
jgi:hypothetical protein